ncbi:MAG TPA: S8 family serine peptidase [Streptosporangiaceae bacterium]
MRGKAKAALACAVTIVAVGPAAFAAGQAAALAYGRAAVLAGHGKPAHSTPSHNAPPPPAGPPTTQTPPGPTANCPPSQAGSAHLSTEPWAQRALQFSSVWGLTRGQRVTVAVVDSGVDNTSQLKGRVTAVDLTQTGFGDCVGHGTAVASIIAASDERSSGVPFYGVAPAARILSIKVNTTAGGFATLMAEGIRQAADDHAGVINVSICTSGDLPALRNAVAYAQSHNAVIVAAAGNDGEPNCTKSPFYPASYPGVVSVAASAEGGSVTGYSGGSRTPISVTAPGADITSDGPRGVSTGNNGTSFAAAFVSGEAALIRSASPHLTAAEVVSRIEATADGTIGSHGGAGIINPVQAVTAVLPSQTTPPAAARQPVSIPTLPHANSFARTVAVSVAAGGFAAALLVVVIAVVLPRGRRRGWRPGRVDLKTITGRPAAPGSDWGEPEEEAPRHRGIHARGAPAAGEVAIRPPAPRRAR